MRAGQFSGLARGGRGARERPKDREGGGGGGESAAVGGLKKISQCARHREGHLGLVCWPEFAFRAGFDPLVVN